AGIAGAFSPGSAYAVANGATLDLNGFNQAIGGLSGAGAVTLGKGNLTIIDDEVSMTMFAGAISGTGALIKIGRSPLFLTGANSYTGGTTISRGTLLGNTKSLQGNILDNAVLIFDQQTDGVFAGSITGSGILVKQNTGLLVLNGDSSAFAGVT